MTWSMEALTMDGWMRQETMNFWKQLTHILKYFRTEEDPRARLPKDFITGFLEVTIIYHLLFIIIYRDFPPSDFVKHPKGENFLIFLFVGGGFFYIY